MAKSSRGPGFPGESEEMQFHFIFLYSDGMMMDGAMYENAEGHGVYIGKDVWEKLDRPAVIRVVDITTTEQRDNE